MESFVLWGFNLYAWITIVTVLTMFTVLLFTKLRADLVFLGAIAILFVTGVLNAKEAFSGFSSTSVVIIGVLFVVVAGLTYTGVLQWIVKHLLGQPQSYSKAVVRLMLPVAALSSFLSNTTVVALFVGIVKMWSKKLNISPSKLLIPLSYASGMGGVCTLIGTPPNLIISGLYADQTGQAMNVLATTLPGLFCLFIGVLSIIAMRKLLPDRQAPEAAFESTSDYTIELLVPSDNPYIGQTVAKAGLKEVHGGSLIEIVHYDDIISPVPDDELIMGGDRLIFAGQIDEVLDLKKSHGLVNADHHIFTTSEVDNDRQLRTAYVTFGSSLINKKIGGSSFEKDNNLVLVAVARRGKRINESPRDVVLQAGDTLPPYTPSHILVMNGDSEGKGSTNCSHPRLHKREGPVAEDDGRGREATFDAPLPSESQYWYFRIAADRFLRNMVRATVGSLIEVGRGKHSPDWIAELIADGTRGDAGESVPGNALFLNKVQY